MAFSRHLHAKVSRSAPRALGVCDLCGKVTNHDTLEWQQEWAGYRLMRTGFLRCQPCIDKPQPQLRTFILPPDPVPIKDPRPGEYSTMVISSNIIGPSDAFGSLFSDQAQISGVGTAIWATNIDGSGAVVSGTATIAAPGLTGNTGSGAVVSSAATIAGTGTSILVGTGNLVSVAAVVGGGATTGTMPSTGAGALVSGLSVIEGTGLAVDSSASGAGNIMGFPMPITYT